MGHTGSRANPPSAQHDHTAQHRPVRHPTWIITVLLAVSLATVLTAEDAPSAAADPQAKSPAAVIYEKIVEENTKDAARAYLAYQNVLDKDQDKVLKALEKAKADLNDIHKYANMNITDRARAIDELNAREKDVQAGALGEGIVTEANAGPLGVIPPTKAIVGTWDVAYSNNHHEVLEIDSRFHVHVISSTWSKNDFDLVYADNKFTVTRGGLLDCYSFDRDGKLTDARGPDIIGTFTRK
jgi:hypothetical protein